METTSTVRDLNRLLRDEMGRHAADAILGANPFIAMDRRQLLAAAGRLFTRALEEPSVLLAHIGRLMLELLRIAAGQSELAPDQHDRRFIDETWRASPCYRRLLQVYLAWRSEIEALLREVNLDPKSRQRAEFALMLVTEALAPTNVLLGNPAALKRAFETGGESLVKGMRRLMDDARHNGGMPTQVNPKPFKVGKNLGVTPGQVVFRSEVLELIQYVPQQPAVYERPLLFVPPQVNKFYILDLAPGKSLIEHALKQGQQVFVISWRNPTPAHRDWDLGTYVQAIREAMDAVLTVTSREDLNVAGVCAGGVTTAVTLGYLEAQGDRRVHAATFLVSVLDTSVPSMMGMFASEKSVASAIRYSREKGILEGKDMARVFAWLRPNDLVWNYWVNNYLLGNAPPAFDILAWNNDNTNLPAALHAEFLALFLENPLVSPGYFQVRGTPIDLSKVKCDVYAVAAMADHITPWKACYRTPALFGARRKEFVLSTSGHIQAMVNPPGNGKARYYTADAYVPDAEAWLRGAAEHQGSWWDHWASWLSTRSGKKLEAKEQLGSEAYPCLEAAPGSYVHDC